MGLLTEIQNDAISDAVPISSLLRKVMLLASNLDSDQLEDWVRHELHGYPDGVDVPAYRIFYMNFKVSGANSRWQITGQNVPQIAVCDAVGDANLSVFKCSQPIGTINEDEVKSSKGVMTVNLDNYVLLLQGKIFPPNFAITRFWAEISSSQILGIIDAVRNRVLEFVLALKKSYPTADDVEWIKNQESGAATVSQVFNTTINNGNAGVIGSANASTVNITVNHGNLQDLRTQLTQHGVSVEDLKELEAALSDEPEIKDKKFGPKVAGWVGNMLGKAGSGVWNVGLGAAGSLLEKALLGYYGFPS
ncbi:AbiTii domain-containing protein [Rhizobium leguminosarum]|uniref:AbiTii domain-containing protein n=1 Tax=Rhizobium leguminosarum TaxID=384 RepID=UPI003F9A2A56